MHLQLFYLFYFILLILKGKCIKMKDRDSSYAVSISWVRDSYVFKNITKKALPTEIKNIQTLVTARGHANYPQRTEFAQNVKK